MFRLTLIIYLLSLSLYSEGQMKHCNDSIQKYRINVDLFLDTIKGNPRLASRNPPKMTEPLNLMWVNSNSYTMTLKYRSETPHSTRYNLVMSNVIKNEKYRDRHYQTYHFENIPIDFKVHKNLGEIDLQNSKSLYNQWIKVTNGRLFGNCNNDLPGNKPCREYLNYLLEQEFFYLTFLHFDNYKLDSAYHKTQDCSQVIDYVIYNTQNQDSLVLLMQPDSTSISSYLSCVNYMTNYYLNMDRELTELENSKLLAKKAKAVGKTAREYCRVRQVSYNVPEYISVKKGNLKCSINLTYYFDSIHECVSKIVIYKDDCSLTAGHSTLQYRYTITRI